MGLWSANSSTACYDKLIDDSMKAKLERVLEGEGPPRFQTHLDSWSKIAIPHIWPALRQKNTFKIFKNNMFWQTRMSGQRVVL